MMNIDIALGNLRPSTCIALLEDMLESDSGSVESRRSLFAQVVCLIGEGEARIKFPEFSDCKITVNNGKVVVTA